MHSWKTLIWNTFYFCEACPVYSSLERYKMNMNSSWAAFYIQCNPVSDTDTFISLFTCTAPSKLHYQPQWEKWMSRIYDAHAPENFILYYDLSMLMTVLVFRSWPLYFQTINKVTLKCLHIEDVSFNLINMQVFHFDLINFLKKLRSWPQNKYRQGPL